MSRRLDRWICRMSTLLILKDDMLILILAVHDRVGFVCCVQSWLVCNYCIYSTKKTTCGAHSVHKRIHLKDTAQQDQRYNNKIVIISHTLPATLKAVKKQAIKRGCGTTAIPQTNHAFHSFHASFWWVDCSTFKAASEKIPSQNYEMTEHVIQLQRWAWTHGLHCPPRCGFDIGASLAIEAARSLAKDWCCWDCDDGEWSDDHGHAFVWATSTFWLQSFGSCAAHVKSTERFQTHAGVSMSSE